MHLKARVKQKHFVKKNDQKGDEKKKKRLFVMHIQCKIELKIIKLVFDMFSFVSPVSTL